MQPRAPGVGNRYLIGREKIRKFCLLTSGRAGSTALMDVLAGNSRVATPGADVECVDHELLHPARAADYARFYSARNNTPIRSSSGLVDAFYASHEEAGWAGFKTMFNRHKDLPDLVGREDIRFITLLRRDIPATVASFMLAMEQGTWRREGGPTAQRWTFSEENRERVLSNIAYVLQSHRIIDSVPNAIALEYEKLCRPDFSSPELDEFFQERIFLPDAKPPVDPATYVSNWDHFQDFCDHAVIGLRDRAPRSRSP